MRGKASGIAAVLTLPVLLAPTACGTPGAPAAATSAAARAPTSLRRAALEAGDVPGYQVSADPLPDDAEGTPRADRAACAPLAGVMGDRPDDHARETVSRGLGSRTVPGLAVSASLSAYAAADARHLITELRTALSRCTAGFSTVLDGRRAAYSEVRATAYEVKGGESVSWTARVLTQGAPAPVHIVVVRRGATVVRFMAINLSAKAPPAVTVPHEIADKQLGKLARTVRD
ncbi:MULTISPECIES: hypothetical protein [unclassified Streptomyces]|uniref:hypothetical protein n=1 Tax=unclassified Streptomyces TaxID=2593676 RepID=UPI003812A6BD